MPALLDKLIAAKDSAGVDLALAISAEFDKTYQQSYDGIDRWLSLVMDLDRPSSRRVETYGMIESLPVPERWNRGDPIPTEGTGAKRFSVVNYTYAKRIEWHREDREDTLVGDILPRFRQLAQRMALVAPKAAVEIISNSASLLPAIPNAPDGAALFSATDGESANRFGVSGGNIITGDGTAAANVNTNFYEALQRFAEFQDTKGEPYFEPNIGAESFLILSPVGLRAAMVEAFKAEIVYSLGGQTYAAGVSNLAQASGASVQMLFTSRLSGNDWFIFRSDAAVKPLFELTRRPVMEESALAESNNSDSVRNTGMEYVQYSRRAGYAVNVPFGAIKIDNS